MTRKISKEGLERIKSFEGCRLTAYKDVAGVWTIGYGNTLNVRQGMTITQPEAESRLKVDLERFEQCVDGAVKVSLNDNQFAALVSLSFNIGASAFAGSTLLKKLNAGDYAGAQGQFGVWRKAGGEVVQGLVNRRAQEAALFGKGDFVSSAVVDTKAAAPDVLTKENISWGSTIVCSLGAAMTGEGYIQMALAALILVGGLTGLYLFVRKRVNPK